MSSYKVVLLAIAIFAVYYGCVWLFNHSGYPFVAIIIAILFTTFLGTEAYKKLKDKF